jgi:hypothetical protein
MTLLLIRKGGLAGWLDTQQLRCPVPNSRQGSNARHDVGAQACLHPLQQDDALSGLAGIVAAVTRANLSSIYSLLLASHLLQCPVFAPACMLVSVPDRPANKRAPLICLDEAAVRPLAHSRSLGQAPSVP